MLIPHDSNDPHPLLRQIPLTVSPFISLPSAPTLPYTYKPLPSTLPPPFISSSDNDHSPEKYVISPSGHAASPDDIIKSCQSIQAHIENTHRDALKQVEDWEARLKEEELAEKRRVAPGWLDRGERLLEPEKAGKAATGGLVDGTKRSLLDENNAENEQPPAMEATRPDSAGEELDRAFGAIGFDPRK